MGHTLDAQVGLALAAVEHVEAVVVELSQGNAAPFCVLGVCRCEHSHIISQRLQTVQAAAAPVVVVRRPAAVALVSLVDGQASGSGDDGVHFDALFTLVPQWLALGEGRDRGPGEFTYCEGCHNVHANIPNHLGECRRGYDL